MHKYFLVFLAFFLFGLHLSAQVEYGTITYIRTSQVKIDAGQGETVNKELKEMMAKMAASGAFTDTYLATFTPDGFNFVEQEKEHRSNTMESGGMTIVVETGPANLTHYHTDLQTGTITNTDYIFDKQFLVSGETEEIDWTLTKEKVAPSEATAGLDLLVATGISAVTGDTLTAGYAPSLPVQVGPKNYYGLPGAIITLEVKNGRRNYRYQATQLSLSTEALPLEKPTEGKAIKEEKFLKEKEKRERAGMKRTMMIGG
jgi:GLPGLI family protein